MSPGALGDSNAVFNLNLFSVPSVFSVVKAIIMSKPILVRSAAELLETILTGKLPADAQMEKYFRAHPQMGVRDRGFVAETVYG